MKMPSSDKVWSTFFASVSVMTVAAWTALLVSFGYELVTHNDLRVMAIVVTVALVAFVVTVIESLSRPWNIPDEKVYIIQSGDGEGIVTDSSGHLLASRNGDIYS